MKAVRLFKGTFPKKMFMMAIVTLLFVAAWGWGSEAPCAQKATADYELGEILVTSDRAGEDMGIAIDPTATSVVIDTYESAKSPLTVQDIL